MVNTLHGTVGRNHNNIEFVDVPELTSLGLCCTGHARKFLIHAEVVLQSDSSKRLCGCLNLHVLLRLNGLVQTVGIAAALHNTARLLIHNLHFVVDNHILNIALKHRISLKQLVYSVNAFGFYRIVLQNFVFLLSKLGCCQVLLRQFGYLSSDIGQHKEILVFGVRRNKVDTLVSQLNSVLFLFNDEVKVIGDEVHVFAVVLHVEIFGFLHQNFHARLTQVFDKRFVLWQAFIGAQ